MGTVVLDSSVVLGLMDIADAHNERATSAVIKHLDDGGAFLLPAVAYSEVLVSEARRGKPQVRKRQGLLKAIFRAPRIIDDTVAEEAAWLRAKHRSLRLPDALVIAVGIVDQADAVLTADKRWAGIDDRVQVLTD